MRSQKPGHSFPVSSFLLLTKNAVLVSPRHQTYAGTCEPFIRHGTEEACVRNTVDISTYTVSTCAYTKPHISSVRSATRGRDPSCPGFPDSLYPVWVDCLGSTTEDGLPACQTEKLAYPGDSASLKIKEMRRKAWL